MKLVMVGNCMAGARTLEELLKIAPDLYDITVFGAEPHANYNRILLSPVLAGDLSFSEIMLNDLDWYRERGIVLHLNKKVTRIDRCARRVIAEDATEERYDRLLLATGSTPVVLPVPGRDLEGVSPMSRYVNTPSRSLPGTGSTTGVEPVASSSRS